MLGGSILFLLVSIPVNAAVIQAASCSYADVSAAVAAAQPGDTVRVPAGTAAWPSSLTVGKAIAIIGAGSGPGGTTLTASGPLQNGFFYISGITSTDLLRISGFTFRLNDITASNAVFMYPNNLSLSRLRIDHNEFHNGYTAVFLAGAKGTVDHNRFVNAFRGISFTAGTRAQADASWESMTAGSADAMFIEDNSFVIDAGFLGTTNDQCLDTHNGGKLVIRYNHVDGRNTSTTFDNNSLFWVFQTHGNACGGCSGSGYWQSDATSRRGQSVVEIYHNLVEGKRTAYLYAGRGGSNLIFNNITNCTQHMSGIYFYEEEQTVASNWNLLRTAWPAEDQVHNTYIWGNRFNGGEQGPSHITIGATSGDYIQLGRDFVLHEPRSSGGREVFTGANGASGSFPTDGNTLPTLGTMVFEPAGPNAHFPYVPHIYPHPLSVLGENGRLLNLQAGAGSGQVNLAWQAVSGAADYRIVCDWNESAAVITTSFSWIGALPIGAHACMVYARDGSGKILAAEGKTVTVNSETNQSLNLVPGWNWISFNVLPADRSLNTIFGGILGQVEQVRTQTQSALRLNGNWVGDLANMDGIQQGRMYKIRVTAACTLMVTETRIASNTPISLNAGWNWISFYPSTPLPINQALSSITSQVQQVRSQTQSAIYQNGQWIGDLAQMAPGLGYTIRMENPGTLIYPGGQ